MTSVTMPARTFTKICVRLQNQNNQDKMSKDNAEQLLNICCIRLRAKVCIQVSHVSPTLSANDCLFFDVMKPRIDGCLIGHDVIAVLDR